jgi:UDPglucose 6-dehydrogenase
MKITVIGTGYVGLVTGACLADIGNEVLCLDVDQKKIDLLNSGSVPIYEPGLQELVRTNVDAGRLSFTSDFVRAVRHGYVQFIAVGTPPGEDGAADLSYVLAAATTIADHMEEQRLVVNKSTVPVGTGDVVRQTIQSRLATRGKAIKFSVVSNPEFLKEGSAIADFMKPDRIVVGTTDDDSIRVMRQLYAPFERNHAKLMLMSLRSAELTKYAANAMLATRISFMNELAQLAESVDADVDQVRRGIGSDPRIGPHFLYAGCGYGGSCFPKDIQALLRTAKGSGKELRILQAVELANTAQKLVLLEKIVRRMGSDLTGKRIAIWGLSFKPDTDDMREAPSRVLIPALLGRGATVVAYDPVAMDEARHLFADQDQLSFSSKALYATENADALAIVTEWKEFRSPDLQKLKRLLRQPLIFDGRNILDPTEVRAAGFEYSGIGRP